MHSISRWCWLALLVAGATGAADQMAFERPQGAAGAHLRIVGPAGVMERSFAAGEPIVLSVRDPAGAVLADGHYRWELVHAPQVDATLRATTRTARETGDERQPVDWPEAIASRSGGFSVRDGAFVDPMQSEPSDRKPPGDAVAAPKDQVIADDLIVQGSGCFGFDCVNNENFGFDTIRLKENNTQIAFDDTSASGGFAANDWALVANDAASGGASRFFLRDVTGSTEPFSIRAGAPTSSINVDATGRVGLRTSTPVLDLHVSTGNTPAIRLEQTSASGFTGQTWDIASNEANFFIRDVTGGSRLSFRIRPGAPTSSIDIAGSGNVGIGTGAPAAKLHVVGDGFFEGAVTQLSSRAAKTDLVAVSGERLLDALEQLPIWTWNYLSASSADRHIGPVAEDFHARFGFGRSNTQLAPSDVAGVALAAAQALSRQVAERDARIADLESRLRRLEEAMARGADPAPANAAQSER